MSEPLPKLCTNCKTERFGIYRRGYCYRCYRLTLRKEEVERWDLKDPSTWKRFPAIPISGPKSLEKEFSEIKTARLREFEYRLWLLATHERQRSQEVSGLQIEHALRSLAEWCGGKEDFYGIASEVSHYFGAKQRQILLGWFFDIEESMHWDPRRYWHALHPEEVQRIAAQNRAGYEPFDQKASRSRRL